MSDSPIYCDNPRCNVVIGTLRTYPRGPYGQNPPDETFSNDAVEGAENRMYCSEECLYETEEAPLEEEEEEEEDEEDWTPSDGTSSEDNFPEPSSDGI